jgi:hypothetical protein
MATREIIVDAPPEPTLADLDTLIEGLKASWTSRITVRRQSKDDIGIREIFVSLDGDSLGILSVGQEVSRELTPGPHRLTVHNTLFRKSQEFTVRVGEHAGFAVSNRAGFGTYSPLAFFLGAMLVYLSLRREDVPPAC